MTTVSVIMPYFKKKFFLKQSIKSVLKQTYKNFEIIIIYDDENNSEFRFVQSLKKLDKRIRVLKNKKNIGAGESRNIGIKNAKGKFIAFLDCDDLWNKNKLKYQLSFMNKKKIDFSHTSYDIITSRGVKISSRIAPQVIDYKSLLRSCDIGLSTVVMKKKLFGKNIKFANTKTKEDFALWLNLTKQKKVKVIEGIDKSLTKWRKLKNSLSSNLFQKILDGYRIYNEYMKFNPIKSVFYLGILSINYLYKKDKNV